MRRDNFDVLIVGGGPAGIAAAFVAGKAGRRVGVLDQNPGLGGQIWRGEGAKPNPPKSAEFLLDMVRTFPVTVLTGSEVVGLASKKTLLVATPEGPAELGYDRLILATGARELFLPFPGWTLPNVMGAGGLQALVKSGLPIAGKRVAVAGSGPLLFAVAAYLKTKKAEVRVIVEQAPLGRLIRFGKSLAAAGKLGQALGLKWKLLGVPYRAGCWPVSAEGNGRLEAVTFTNGRRPWTERVDYLACGFGLVPNLELPALLGCRIGPEGVAVDRSQRTSVADVYAAGELTGIGGVDLAQVEGLVAGRAAAGDQEIPGLQSARSVPQADIQFATTLRQTFALRDELRQLSRPETIVCRCEDVSLGRLAGFESMLDAKLQTRCGMGPCQGRICGAALAFLRGWEAGSVRPPVFATDLSALASEPAMPDRGPRTLPAP